MQAATADAVHAVFSHGLSLRDRLDAGEPIQRDLERARLTELLAALDPPAGGLLDEGNDLGLSFSERDSPEELARLSRATIRYALTCWLGEWLALELAGPIADGGAGEKFWDEARYAETRADLEALEVMYLCVMLGYRGNRRDRPEQLGVWVARTRAKVSQSPYAWAMPAGLQPPADASMGAGDLPMRRMAFSVLLTLSLLLPLGLAFWWRR